MELTLNSYKIFEIGEDISKRLHECGITKKSKLAINVTNDELRKIDEDLYYRNNPNGTDYVPSDGELLVTFDNLIIEIKAEKGAP